MTEPHVKIKNDN